MYPTAPLDNDFSVDLNFMKPRNGILNLNSQREDEEQCLNIMDYILGGCNRWAQFLQLLANRLENESDGCASCWFHTLESALDFRHVATFKGRGPREYPDTFKPLPGIYEREERTDQKWTPDDVLNCKLIEEAEKHDEELIYRIKLYINQIWREKGIKKRLNSYYDESGTFLKGIIIIPGNDEENGENPSGTIPPDAKSIKKR
jgi:hypothetical protein